MVYLVTLSFVLLDLITGLVKAFKEKTYSSSVMREGLFHKSASIIVVVMARMADFAQTLIDIGVTVPLTNIICGYIMLMEIGSIIENVGKINPKFIPAKLRSYFVKLSDNGGGTDDNLHS